MGSVEHDHMRYHSELARDFARDDYAVENRDRFMAEAIEEEAKQEFAVNFMSAAEHLGDRLNKDLEPFIQAYLMNDDTELGRLVRLILKPEIEESAVMRAERMAAEHFDTKY